MKSQPAFNFTSKLTTIPNIHYFHAKIVTKCIYEVTADMSTLTKKFQLVYCTSK